MTESYYIKNHSYRCNEVCAPHLLAGWRNLRIWLMLLGSVFFYNTNTPFVLAASYPRCSIASDHCAFVRYLLAQRQGYGRFATGGLGGEIIQVSSNKDSGPGTLRDTLGEAGNLNKSVWLRFASDMTIRLKSQIRVPSNVTIDGRDHEIKLIDYGLGIYNSQNIIITHLTIDGRFRTFSQAINIANYSHTVWIDHLDLSRFSDRLVNVKNGSTNVTLSWNRFHNHNKVMLLNNIISSNLFKYYKRDSQSRVTLHHNYFFNTVQRNPRAQFGIFHLYNNLIENWDLYGMSFSLEAHVLMEGNIFINKKNRPCREPKYFFTVEGEIVNYCHSLKEAPVRSALPNGDSDRQRYNNTKKKYRYTHGVKAFIKTRDNLYLDDARQVLNNYRAYKVAMPPYRYCYEKPSGALRDRIRRFAGNTRKDFVARQNAQTCSRQ